VFAVFFSTHLWKSEILGVAVDDFETIKGEGNLSGRKSTLSPEK